MKSGVPSSQNYDFPMMMLLLLLVPLVFFIGVFLLVPLLLHCKKCPMFML